MWDVFTNFDHKLVLTHDLKAFDAPFFGFTQQEATSLDPQQRLLLECTFEALESAGVPKHEVVGKDVGVFVGGTFSEYEADLFRDPDTIPMHQATGMPGLQNFAQSLCTDQDRLRHGYAVQSHLTFLRFSWTKLYGRYRLLF
jgi:3-oxoacyl-(acyl-carrier-protein) synthase